VKIIVHLASSLKPVGSKLKRISGAMNLESDLEMKVRFHSKPNTNWLNGLGEKCNPESRIYRSDKRFARINQPTSFSLHSAWIGYEEPAGYSYTTDFAMSTGIGLVGFALTAAGLWMSLPYRKAKEFENAN